ncbi:efflux RND transporter periplasmic adaptor subunit [Novilysobacter longmucuonensis]|uniref:efflux RND transporter periplasmic adaptor subunit n=1 Tax=Novilysobacter longmucuonensis TaxID=3098603 RepID=UPI003FA082F5
MRRPMRSAQFPGVALASGQIRLVLVLIALSLAACAGDDAAGSAARPVLVVQPTTDRTSGSSFAGDVRAREESPLSFRVGGNLVERRVDVGDRVAAGDLLAVLEAGDFQAQARASRAQLEAAEAELARARADQARFAQLAEEQLVSRSRIDAQDAAAAAAQGRVDAARANLRVARNQTGYTQLRAPADGVIAARSAEAGQVVAAGQTVFTLAADGAREVAFAVPEGAIGRIASGQAVQVELWAQDGRRWPGQVREVAPAADPASRTYAARATVDAPAGALQLGQSARVLLEGDVGAALGVPLAALQRQIDGQGATVFVVDQETSTLRLQAVEVGPYREDRVPVTGGLSADAWVVAAGGHLLREGQKVSAVDRDNRPLKPTTITARE